MRFVVFQDSAGQWRWHLKAGNNRIMGDGGEGYSRERDARAAIQKIVGRIRAQDVPVV